MTLPSYYAFQTFGGCRALRHWQRNTHQTSRQKTSSYVLEKHKPYDKEAQNNREARFRLSFCQLIDIQECTKHVIQMVSTNDMVESAVVHGNYYGTSRKQLEKIGSTGRIPLLDIDIRGVESISKLMPIQAIFLLPPSHSVW